MSKDLVAKRSVLQRIGYSVEGQVCLFVGTYQESWAGFVFFETGFSVSWLSWTLICRPDWPLPPEC